MRRKQRNRSGYRRLRKAGGTETTVVLNQCNSASLEGCGTKTVNYLVAECVACADGIGPVIDIGTDRGKLLVLTLAINCVIEKESLIVFISGSTDKTNWDNERLVSFPPKHYCGMYSILLNLARYPDVRYIRVEWNMGRWGRGDASPMFGFSVSAEESGSRVSVSAAWKQSSAA